MKVVATDGILSAEDVVDNLPECFTQIVVNDDLHLPVAKPDVGNIIDFQVNPKVNMVKSFQSIDGTKFIVSGSVDIGVTYVANVSDQTEHFAEFEVPFFAVMVCPNLSVDAKVEPVILIEHVQWHIINPRTIRKFIVLFVGLRELL